MATLPTSSKYSRYYTYIKPVIENKTVRSVLPYVFSLVTITIFVLFAIRPTVSTIVSLQQQIENDQQILNSLNQKTKDLTQARTNYNNLPIDTRTKINTAVPSQANVTTLIASLQNSLPQQASVSALQIQPITLVDTTFVKKRKPLLAEVEFTFNVQGSYSQLLESLNNLTTASRVISVKNLVISRQEEAGTIMSLTGKAFYLK